MKIMIYRICLKTATGERLLPKIYRETDSGMEAIEKIGKEGYWLHGGYRYIPPGGIRGMELIPEEVEVKK